MRYRLRHDALAGLLAASRLSQNHWAIRLGLGRGHWSDIVNGRHPFPSAKTRQRMLEVFGVSLDELFVPDSGRAEELDFRLALAHRYEIVSELGQGAMGAVHLATDRALGRLVAMKVVAPEAAALLTEIGFIARIVAAIVGTIGLYSVLSFLVIEQRRAYAIRLAIGAAPRSVGRAIVAYGLLATAAGIAVGYTLLVGLRHVVEPLLFHTRLLEPTTMVVVATSSPRYASSSHTLSATPGCYAIRAARVVDHDVTRARDARIASLLCPIPPLPHSVRHSS